MKSRVRLAVLVSHPIQHFAPWHRELAKLPEVELKVFFYTNWGISGTRDPGFNTDLTWDVPLLDGYDHEFLKQKNPREDMNTLAVDNPGVSQALDNFQPDVVKVFGYAHRTSWRAARWAKANSKPLMLYSDSNIKAQTFWKKILKRPVVRFFYSHVDGALFVGDNNRDYHAYHGVPSSRLFRGCLPIDRERLLSSVPDRASTRRELREQYGIPEDGFVAMFCGKYIPRKMPLDVINAAGELRKSGAPVYALMVGEGPMRAEMEELIRTKGFENAKLTGFVNQSEIAKYYAASDALVVSSSFDPHPLIVTEASAFGLPIIASDAIGCVGGTDSAREGVNTIVYPCGDANALREALAKLQRDKGTYEKLAKGAIVVASDQDVCSAANQLSDAVHRLYELQKR